MAWCLVPEKVQQFKQALRNKEIDPTKLANMTSAERRAFLEKFVGSENSKQVNTLFESKLLLKNQQRGYITWAKKVSGMTPQAKRDLISKIERMDKILNPEEEKAFLQDLAEQRLGIGITVDEAKKLSELSTNIRPFADLKDAMGLPTKEYMVEAKKMADYIQEITPDIPRSTAIRIAGEIAGVPRALMTTADFSASFRQAAFFIPKHPILFAKAFVKQFKPAFSEKAYQDLQASIQTDPF
mgnify:FL=1